MYIRVVFGIFLRILIFDRKRLICKGYNFSISDTVLPIFENVTFFE